MIIKYADYLRLLLQMLLTSFEKKMCVRAIKYASKLELCSSTARARDGHCSQLLVVGGSLCCCWVFTRETQYYYVLRK